ncbi:MAG: VWA domain-containing protein [Promethearchaeota archaeon]|nr:MAG: VWA domain-containing protein [Candidatus Lokiarchaeota archaeon]
MVIIRKQKKGEIKAIVPSDIYLARIRDFYINLLDKQGLLSNVLGKDIVSLINGIYYIPNRSNISGMLSPIHIDIKERNVYLTKLLLNFSKKALIGLLCHEIGHTVLAPQNIEKIDALYQKLDVPKRGDAAKILHFCLNLVSDYLIEKHQFSNYPALRIYKRQQFLEVKYLREELGKELKFNEKILINRIITHILFDEALFNESRRQISDDDPIKAVICDIKEILDCPLNWFRQTCEVYNYINSLKPPNLDQKDFAQKLKEFNRIVKLFPFLRKRLRGIEHNKRFIESLPESFREAFKLAKKIKARARSFHNKKSKLLKDTLSKNDLETKFLSRFKKDLLEMLKREKDINLEDFEQADIDELEDFITVLLIDDRYLEETPDLPYTLNETLKNEANADRKSKLDEEIEDKLENAKILLEEATTKKKSNINIQKVGLKNTRNISDLVDNFGMEAVFSLLSDFKRPFTKDLIEESESFNDTLFIMMDISTSMNENQIDACKTIITSLIQYAADHRIEIAVATFNYNVNYLRNEFDEIFWRGDFYSLLEQVINIKATGGTSFNTALKEAAKTIKEYQSQCNEQLRFLFLTDGQSTVYENTYEELRTLKDLKSLFVYINSGNRSIPNVLVKLGETMKGKLLRIKKLEEGRIKIIKELLNQ